MSNGTWNKRHFIRLSISFWSSPKSAKIDVILTRLAYTTMFFFFCHTHLTVHPILTSCTAFTSFYYIYFKSFYPNLNELLSETPHSMLFALDMAGTFTSRTVSLTVTLSFLWSPDGSTGCDYEEKTESDVERVDASLPAQTQGECQQQCDSTQNFLCHAYSFRQSSATCRLSSDDTFNLGSSAVRRRIGSSYYQRANCLDRE